MSNSCLSFNVTLFTRILRDKGPAYEKHVERIESASTWPERAVQCITSESLYSEDSSFEELILEMITAEVLDPLRAWRGEESQDILHVAFGQLRIGKPFLIRAISKNIGITNLDLTNKTDISRGYPRKLDYRHKIPEHCLLAFKRLNDFQLMAKQALFGKRVEGKPWLLLPHLKFNQEDKIECEMVLKRLNSREIKEENIFCEFWYRAAQQCPGSDDSQMATFVARILLQQPERYIKDGLLTDLIKNYPDIDVNKIIGSVDWPLVTWPLPARYIRSESPKWLLEGLMKTSVEDCNYNWIRKRSANANFHQIEPGFFHYFEDLPDDLIYYMALSLDNSDLITLSLTSKRIQALIQTVCSQKSQKYFTNLTFSSTTDFHNAYKSKFEAGKLLGHFRFTKESVLSTELNGDFAVISQNSGISLLRTFCLTRPKRRKTLTTIKLDYALERAARLFNDRIYVVSSGPYPDQKQVSIVNPKSEWKVKIECPLIDNDNVYFTIEQNKLLAKGFSMDVTTQQITRTNWSSDLSKWVIRDAAIYGYEVLTPPSESGSNVLLQIFDERTEGKVVSGLNIEEFKCFNVKSDDIYVVSSHVMQWDKRYLANPVRTSTDPIYVNKSKASHPAIDLTAMRVISPDQIWDLTDFTWQLPNIHGELPYVTTNGILVAYSSDSSLNIRQSPCTRNYCGPLVTIAELSCKKI